MFLGTDIVDLKRFEKSLERKGFIDLIFHESEKAYCEGVAHRVAAYGARFAAKEAFAKAIGTGFFKNSVTPKDVWVEREMDGDTAFGPPKLIYTTKLTKVLDGIQVKTVRVSLTHDGDYASASVILF